MKMKYTFEYKRIEFGRLYFKCVEIPSIHVEQLYEDSGPVQAGQTVTDALNLFLSITFLINSTNIFQKQDIPLPGSVELQKGKNYIGIDVNQENAKRILGFMEEETCKAL